MNKIRLLLICFSASIFGTELIIEAKVQLCHPPPNWTVNNGINPMRESLGNVTLVTLLNASFRFGLKQALSMENMLRFLKSTGLKDFHFIVINANSFDASEKFEELSNKVSFAVYQETDKEVVWDLLDGGKDDMFIYDRCGLLTYYIPFPLSIIHAQQPILQAALLSTYFDNPCGESCDTIEDTTTTTTSKTSTTSRSITLALSAINTTINDTLYENLKELEGLEQTSSTQTSGEVTDDDWKEKDFVFPFSSDRTKESTTEFPEIYSGSGSGDQEIKEDLIDINVRTEISTQSSDTKTESNESSIKEVDDKEESVNRWKIFDFFKSKDNRSDEDIYDEIYNASNPEYSLSNNNNNDIEKGDSTSTPSSMTSVKASTFTTQTSNTPPITTISSSIWSTTTPKRTRSSFFGSAARAKCDAFNQSMCIEWSTDRLLRARLCCLTEMLSQDEEPGFGCRHFDRNKCHRMLPLIKCCLKDFSQLIESYFQSVSRPSRPRNRYNKKSTLF